jgi:hypothetical protein
MGVRVAMLVTAAALLPSCHVVSSLPDCGQLWRTGMPGEQSEILN